MVDSNELLEMLLRECQATTPQPWYPAIYIKETGLDRAKIDAELDRLRMAGLLRLTDWVQGQGQGYVLTPEGNQVLQSPKLLRQLREGTPVTLRVEPIEAPPGFTPLPRDHGEAVRAVLMNPGRPLGTLALLFANILVFLVGLSMAMEKGITGDYLGFSQDRQILSIQSSLGSLNRSQVVERDQWWRLITYCFVHGGLLHILMNMYFLYSLGPLVETMWGSIRFLLLYLISGLAGGCGVVLANTGPLAQVGIVGASGALCGILASMGVWVYLNRRHLGPELSSRWLRGIMTNVLLIVLISMLPRVSAMGHFAGGAAGALVAVPLVYQRFGHGAARILGALGTAAVPLVCVGLVLGSITPADRDDQALRTMHDDLLHTDKTVKRAREFLLPILKEEAQKWFVETANIERGIRESNIALERLEATATDVRELKMTDADVRQAAQLAQEYCTAYISFFEGMKEVLAAKAPPNDVQRDNLIRDLNRAHDLVDKLKASVIFAR